VLGKGFALGFYLLASLLVFVDLFDLLLRAYFRRVQTLPPEKKKPALTSVPLNTGDFSPYQMRLHLRPYALLVSVYNMGEELDAFLEAMRPHFARLWVIDDASTDDTWARLSSSGVRCVRGEENRNKPGAIKHLLTALPPEIETVLIMDPDARILDRGGSSISDLERVIFEFQRCGMAALCPRIGVRPVGWLGRIQSFEYWIAFGMGRWGLADHSITSGMAVYRREMLARILEEHSLSVYAEDLENTMILLGQGQRVYYDGRLVIETDGKRDWSGWFSQRVGWTFGLLKVYTRRLFGLFGGKDRRPLFIYHYLVYIGFFTLLLHPLKLVSLALLAASAANGVDNLLGLNWIPDGPATNLLYFPLAYLKYTTFSLLSLWLAVSRGERRRLAPVVPVYFFYALIHLMPSTLGYLNWFSLRLNGRRIYRDHYEKEGSHRLEPRFEERRRKAS